MKPACYSRFPNKGLDSRVLSGERYLRLLSDLGSEGELGISLALVGGGQQVGPGYPPCQCQGCLHQHLPHMQPCNA